MKKANLVLMAALAAVGLAGITAGSLLPVTAAVAADRNSRLENVPFIIFSSANVLPRNHGISQAKSHAVRAVFVDDGVDKQEVCSCARVFL